MKYRNKTVSLSQMVITAAGAIHPLCNNCTTKDCSHVIEKKRVSVFGVNKDWRLMFKGTDFQVVIDCEGYSI